MSDLSRIYEASPRRRFALIGSLLRSWFGAAIAGLAYELRIRRDTRRLLEAEPRTLKDLGITRADVERLVRYGRDASRR